MGLYIPLAALPRGSFCSCRLGRGRDETSSDILLHHDSKCGSRQWSDCGRRGEEYGRVWVHCSGAPWSRNILDLVECRSSSAYPLRQPDLFPRPSPQPNRKPVVNLMPHPQSHCLPGALRAPRSCRRAIIGGHRLCDGGGGSS